MAQYDCIICGAGLSGFAAAIGAAESGAKVMLFDRMPSAGGSAVYALTPVLSGWNNGSTGSACGKLLADKLDSMGAFEWRQNKIITDEDSLQKAMTSLLSEHNVTTLYNAKLCSVEKQGKRIVSVGVMTSGGMLNFTADTFVDASGDGVLSLLAGAEIITPSPEESMTKTVMFKVRNVKGFERETVKKLFSDHVEKFPVKIQNQFMGLPLLDKDEVLLNLTAVSGNAADPQELSVMYDQLTGQIEPIMEFLRKYIPCFADAVVTKVSPIAGIRYTRSVKGER
ncbi:MAG: FAD-dependent oxidoreductase, partial [Lentisphaeria bacterium]|nr:FAD-dependent oxidoreductase [Lentisphaeria bacterium]